MDPGDLREVKEIAHLHLRYAHTRIEWPQRVLALAHSIERFGQILPVIVLREGANPFVLLDGYLRVKALKRCLRNTVMAEIWEGKWLRELRAIVHMLRGLLKQVPMLFYPGQSNLDRRILLTAFEEGKEHFRKLEAQIRRYDGHDHSGDEGNHFEPLSERSSDPADQPAP